MEIFVFISCGVQTKTFKVEAGGCKSIKAYHLFAIGNLNVNNTDIEGENILSKDEGALLGIE